MSKYKSLKVSPNLTHRLNKFICIVDLNNFFYMRSNIIINKKNNILSNFMINGGFIFYSRFGATIEIIINGSKIMSKNVLS